MTEPTDVLATVAAALDVIQARDLRPRDKLTLIARRWRAAGVAQSRSPAVWAAKRAVLSKLITETKCVQEQR